MKVLKCPICARVRITSRRFKTCSQKCGQELRRRLEGVDVHRRNGYKAGRRSGQVRKEKSDREWRERWPDAPVATAKQIYTQGFNSGHASGRRLGFQQGYEAALSGLRLERSA